MQLSKLQSRSSYPSASLLVFIPMASKTPLAFIPWDDRLSWSFLKSVYIPPWSTILESLSIDNSWDSTGRRHSLCFVSSSPAPAIVSALASQPASLGLRLRAAGWMLEERRSQSISGQALCSRKCFWWSLGPPWSWCSWANLTTARALSSVLGLLTQPPHSAVKGVFWRPCHGWSLSHLTVPWVASWLLHPLCNKFPAWLSRSKYLTGFVCSWNPE